MTELPYRDAYKSEQLRLNDHGHRSGDALGQAARDASSSHGNETILSLRKSAGDKGSLPKLEIHGLDSKGSTISDLNGGQTKIERGADGSKTESYLPGTAHSSTTDAGGKIIYSDKVDKSGNYTQSGATKDGGAWTMTSDRSGPTSSQNWDRSGASTSWNKDAAGHQTRWSADGKSQTEVTTTGDGGTTSRTTSSTTGASGQTSDYQHWKADGSSVHSGPIEGGGHYSLSSDAQGKAIQLTRRDQSGNYSKSGPTADGGAFSQTRNPSGQVTDTKNWNKNGDLQQAGKTSAGVDYSLKNSADGQKQEYSDKFGTSKFSHNANDTETKQFVSAEGNVAKNYLQNTDKSGSGAILNQEGKTAWDQHGGGSFKSADGKTNMHWDDKGVGSFRNADANVKWDAAHNVTTVSSADGVTSSRTVNQKGQTLDSQNYHADGSVSQSAGPHAPGGAYTMTGDAAGFPRSFSTAEGTHSYAYERKAGAAEKPGYKTTDTFTPAAKITSWGQ